MDTLLTPDIIKTLTITASPNAPSHGYEALLPASDGEALRLYHEVLENRVRERTEQLEAVNRALEADIAERKQAERALDERLRYEEGLAACSQELLSDGPLETVLPRALDRLRLAAGVCEIYLYENFDDPVKGLQMRERVCVRTAEDGRRLTYLDGPTVSYQLDADRQWEKELSAGRSIQGLICEFSPAVREYLDPFDILSLLVLPIEVQGHWYGFIGFNDTQTSRIWSEEDVRLLRTGAELIGTYLGRKKSEEALQRYKHLAEHASDIMCFLGDDGRILEANVAAIQAYGYSRDDLLGMNIRDLRALETRERIAAQMEQCFQDATRFETVHIRKDGSTFPAEISSQSMILNGERVLFSVVRDVSERKVLEEQLRHQAFHDSLTHLPNRALFHDRLEHALKSRNRRNCRVALLYMDLDRFKIINDSMGHAAGDELLVEVTERLQLCLRVEDTLARLGGDEFAILMEEVSCETTVSQLAMRLLKALEKPFLLQDHEVFISSSIGITISSDASDLSEEMLQQADMAMYQAKEGGRGRFVLFHPTMGHEAEERLQIEMELRHALERRQFRVHYQPIFSLETGRITGVEALARWYHPHYGLMSPDQFIPLQEQIGLIEAFTLWVLQEAQEQCLRWDAMGFPLDISVNLSPFNLLEPSFTHRVASLLEQTGFAPERLKLEITENAVMMDPARASEMLHRFNDMGIRLSIDDFGTGYSSLAYLKRLPVDEVKIDKSFVLGMNTHNADDIAIVRAIVDLAQCLRKKVVAEGVENRRVWDVLNLLGCDSAQGYYMSRPLSSEQLTDWLHSLPETLEFAHA